LLAELQQKSYLAREMEIAKLLEPKNATVIPALVKKIKCQSENSSFEENVLEILALSADQRSILPVIWRIEQKSYWGWHNIFELLRLALHIKDIETRRKVNQQLIRYLDEGPREPIPKFVTPLSGHKTVVELVDAILQKCGVAELDEECSTLMVELKEKFRQTPDLSKTTRI